MVHANTSHLLPEVYSGKIENDREALGEYGGQKMDTHVVQGIKIATVDQVGVTVIFIVVRYSHFEFSEIWSTTRRCINEIEVNWIGMPNP